ncbi:hypothetical protein NQ315_008541 [Exocentrus adspersus]|uniref:Beta-sarcoglycan n=1 Tax=Exocentrus adspersus TaxID=1586481 RepID=A0AAV8W5H6_9CUCU|nr:hypothetical protein NQ315_008541 [Exocentrus adspersus]
MLESPQTSEVPSDETRSVSIRDKTPLNRSVPKNNNNNNFVSGYAPVESTKPPARGRKTFAFWTLVGLLFILAIGNLILTLTILAVLRLGQGMESIELIPQDGTIKLLGNIDLDHIYKRDGVMEGYQDEPIEITAEDSMILFNLNSRTGRASTKLKVEKNETLFRGITSFIVKNEKDEALFTITDPVFTSLKRGKNLKTNRIQSNKIRSPSGHDLKIEGDEINLKGAEGTKIEGKEIVWSADQDIYLSSNGSIVLSAKDGVYIDVSRIPIAKLNGNSYLTGQFKVCVCVPGGKLFRIPVADPNDRVYCHHINMQQNPCI